MYNRQERENNHLEYKSKVGNSDKDKREFSKDVSGFANANGGFLIIGIEEKEGLPSKICGIERVLGNQKIDEWINNVLISNIEDKIRYEIRIFDLDDEKIVVVLYIAESPKKPHMVTSQKRNTYFIRHNTSVDPATQSEVREMFEYSKKNRDEFENFLKSRNLWDENDSAFGINDNAKMLHNNMNPGSEDKKPFILYSFVPRYLDNNRIKTSSKEFLDWLYKNNRGFNPLPDARLFKTHERKINLYGVVLPDSFKDSNNKEFYWRYLELLDSGFFESGISNDVFYDYVDNNTFLGNVMKLTKIVGYGWLLLGFAKIFFEKIGYYDEVIFQISILNVKNYALGGFGNKDEKTSWAEPFTFNHSTPPLCSHEKFKIVEKFIVNELSDDLIKQRILDLSEKISRAFGEPVVKCFDDKGNFNTKGLRWFDDL